MMKSRYIIVGLSVQQLLSYFGVTWPMVNFQDNLRATAIIVSVFVIFISAGQEVMFCLVWVSTAVLSMGYLLAQHLRSGGHCVVSMLRLLQAWWRALWDSLKIESRM
jgi:uncharacterized membrane protein